MSFQQQRLRVLAVLVN